MVIFFPLSVISAVPGGLGRLLLSACENAAIAADKNTTKTNAARIGLRMAVSPPIRFDAQSIKREASRKHRKRSKAALTSQEPTLALSCLRAREAVPLN